MLLLTLLNVCILVRANIYSDIITIKFCYEKGATRQKFPKEPFSGIDIFIGYKHAYILSSKLADSMICKGRLKVGTKHWTALH